MKCLVLILVLAVAGCADIPSDPEQTLARVRDEHRFRAGLIAGPAANEPALRAFLGRVERAAGGRASVEAGAAEHMLAKLEAGALDLVVGPMTETSPWKVQVHFLPPLRKGLHGQRDLHLVAMARNGENAWISLLHREAAAVVTPK